MISLIFFLFVTSTIQTSYLHLTLTNSSTCERNNDTIIGTVISSFYTINSLYFQQVEYYFKFGKCMPLYESAGFSIDGIQNKGYERFTVEGSNITVHIYTGDDCSGEPVKILEYQLNQCFKNYSQKIYTETDDMRYFLELTNDNFLPQNNSARGNWTTYSAYIYDNCTGMIDFQIAPTNFHILKGHSYLSALGPLFFSCTQDSLFLSAALPGAQSEDDSEYYVYFRSMEQKKCSDRYTYSFLRYQDIRKYMSFECRSDEQFFNEVELEFECTDYLLEEVYYGLSAEGECLGNRFGTSVSRLKTCNSAYGKAYINTTIQLTVSYKDGDCEGSPYAVVSGKSRAKYRETGVKELCHSFGEISNLVTNTWGYKALLTDNIDYSEELSMILLRRGTTESDYSEEDIKKLKTERKSTMYFFRDDACLKYQDWGPTPELSFLPIRGSEGLVGRCDNGQIHARNYTIKGCENVNEIIDKDIWLYGYFFTVLVTCVPFFCNGYTQYDPLVCSGRGTCIGVEQCQCWTNDYFGDYCEYSIYDSITSDGGVGGDGGEIEGLWAIITFPILITVCVICCAFCWVFVIIVVFIVLVVVALIGLLIFVLIFVFVCCICCVFGVFFVCIGLCTSLCLWLQLRKYRKLSDIDLLIKEQELDKDGSVAHIRINEDLFRVPMSEVKVVGDLLGEGGSNSVVFRAKWKGQVVAFKVFRTTFLCKTQQNFNEFEREVSIMSSVSHPNIVRFYGATMNPPRVGILMEYCERGDLADFMRDYKKNHNGKRFAVHEKYRMLCEVISAMDYLHSRNIIHRDIKLENILVDKHYFSKLMDFGISKHVQDLSTVKTMRVGTSIYMAPEIVTSDKYTEKCDVYSFAVLVWVFLTENKHPYSNLTMGVELKVANNPNFRPDIELFESWLPREYQWLSDIVQVCWSHEPEDRMGFGELHTVFLKKKEEMEVIQKERVDSKRLSSFSLGTLQESLRARLKKVDDSVVEVQEVGEKEEKVDGTERKLEVRKAVVTVDKQYLEDLKEKLRDLEEKLKKNSKEKT